MGGGFVGVDIFFVISGYLISGIILRSLAQDSFSFAGFYGHRINRIFPALAVVIAATLAFGSVVLFPPEFSQLGKHAGGGAGFLSNILLWNETGYFDSKNKLLLHLWSLAVEEQFYLLWPLLLVAAWRKKWNVAAIIAAIAIASFLNNVWMVLRSDRSLAFYFPNTRLWELLAGALLAEFERRRKSEAPSRWISEISGVIGLSALLFSITYIRSTMPWPGFLALIPVIGTVLLIGASRSSFINRVIGHRAFVAIGLISYPLYLWHWPLLVFGRLINEGQLPRAGRISLVLTAFGLAWATYQFVEKPIRFGPRRKSAPRVLLPVMGAIAAVGLLVHAGIVRPRLSRQFNQIILEKTEFPRGASFNRSRTRLNAPVVGRDSTRVIALVGDSHMVQYWPRFERLAAMSAASPEIMLLGYGGCPPLPAVNRKGLSWDGQPYNCPLFHRLAVQRLLDRSTAAVVYSACWECYLNEFGIFFEWDKSKRPIGKSSPALDTLFAMMTSEITSLVKLGKRVYIILPNPNSPLNNPKLMLPRRLPNLEPTKYVKNVTRGQIDSAVAGVRVRLQSVARRSGAVALDPIESICTQTGCPTVTLDGHPIYSDDHHFTPSYVREKAVFLDRIVAER